MSVKQTMVEGKENQCVLFRNLFVVYLLHFMLGLDTAAAAGNGDASEENFLPFCSTGWKLTKQVTSVCQKQLELEMPRLTIDNSSFLVQNCGLSVDLWQCDSETLKGVFLGPFTHNVGTWTSINLDLNDYLAPEDRITQFTGDGVDDKGQPIPYPPLHMHHLHVTHPQTNHWFETHGDYELKPGLGYTTDVPDGYCIGASHLSNPGAEFKYQALYNDVRFQDSVGMASGINLGPSEQSGNSSQVGGDRQPYHWYARILFRLKPKLEPCIKVNKMVLFYPMSKESLKDLYQRYPVGNQPAVQYWSMAPTQSGRWIPGAAWQHSHRARYGGLILVKGKHTLASLTGIGRSCLASKRCPVQSEVRQAILNSAGRNVICSNDPDVPWWEEKQFPAQGYGGNYSRQGRFSCEPNFQLVKGEPLTVFSFDTPMWAGQVKEFPQHTMIFGYYVPDSQKPVSRGFLETGEGAMQLVPRKCGKWVPSLGIYTANERCSYGSALTSSMSRTKIDKKNEKYQGLKNSAKQSEPPTTQVWPAELFGSPSPTSTPTDAEKVGLDAVAKEQTLAYIGHLDEMHHEMHQVLDGIHGDKRVPVSQGLPVLHDVGSWSLGIGAAVLLLIATVNIFRKRRDLI